MRLFFHWLLDLLYPPKCAFCGSLLTREQTDLCPKCRAELPYAAHDIDRGEFFRRCVSVFYYEDAVRESILRYKFHGAQSYARVYGRLLSMLLLERGVAFDVLTWVPVSRRRLRKRGYDQSRLLAEAVAREMSVPCVRTLKKTRNNPAQSTMQAFAERRANVLGVYTPFNVQSFAGKRVLLLDDVITSGATLSEASRVLLTAGAARVECATVAAVRDEKKSGR